jgi:hypothetical protein
MRDFLDLSPVPIDEPCAQVGPGDYMPRMRAECKAFVSQLERAFPDALAAGVGFRIRSNPHDMGNYLEVQAVFDDEDEAQTEWAYTIENEIPQFWDDEARAELTAKGFECVPQETHDFWAQDWKESAR